MTFDPTVNGTVWKVFFIRILYMFNRKKKKKQKKKQKKKMKNMATL